MKKKEITWRIAGGSGDGIDSTSKNFAKALMRTGYNIFTHRHYPSRIRGGHTFAEIRISDDEVTSRGDEYDVLLALEEMQYEITVPKQIRDKAQVALDKMLELSS